MTHMSSDFDLDWVSSMISISAKDMSLDVVAANNIHRGSYLVGFRVPCSRAYELRSSMFLASPNDMDVLKGL